MFTGTEKLIYIVVAVFIYFHHISATMKQREKELKKRCEVCGMIIPYVAKICPCCHQAPGNDTNIHNSRITDSDFNKGRQLQKNKKSKGLLAFMFIYPIVAIYIYNNIFSYY